MQVKITRLGVATYLAPDFPLVEENVQSLAAAAQDAASAGATDLVIDLRDVPFIDSKGLEYLVDLATARREAGGSLRLANASPLCKEILAITRLDQTIPVFEDVEGAGRSFL